MRSPSSGWFAFLASAVVFVGLVGFLRWYMAPAAQAAGEPIVVYCADALRQPLEAIAAAYEKETGQPVRLRVGASQTLLTEMEIAQAGDVYLPADDSYLALARKKDLIREVLPLATMSAVVVTSPDARPVMTWQDLAGGDYQIILANPEASAIGKVTRDTLQVAGRWGDLEKRRPVFQAKISDVASAVLLNPKGAGIVWDAVADQYPKLQQASLAELDNARAQVA